MSNVKSKISLSFVMLLVLLMSFGSVFAAVEYVPVYVTVKNAEGKQLKAGTVYTDIKAGDKIYVEAYCENEKALYWASNAYYMNQTGYKTNDKGMGMLGYAYDDTPAEEATNSYDPTQMVIVIPEFEPGSTHRLSIEGIGAVDGLVEDGTTYMAKSGWIDIDFKVPAEESNPSEDNQPNEDDEPSTEVPETTISMTVAVVSEESIKATANVKNGTFSHFLYRWDEDAVVKATTNPLNIAIPDFEPGTTHILTVAAYTTDGKSDAKIYTYKVPGEIEDDLIVEPWMKEDNNMEELAVSLRNDSDDYDKANKNFYALGEEVVYYVDYKNGGDDITRAITLVLELPLDFKVIDAFGGTVDTENNTITWSFPEGLEEDQAGTKVVKVAYTGFDRSSKKYEIVYPVADIYERNKVVDSSAVINYIFKDEDTEITDEHYPYMFGDAGKDTFRPDSTITRAEGALVLTRIFGIDTSGTKVETLYPDLDQTYVEAQKAIVAATKLGLINGYTDGTYRPNNKMTKAEFMKIIASYIEANAEDEDIRGLEVKTDTNIKIYKNPKNVYVTGTTTVNQHWASDWVTMLVRLNMTPVSSSNKNLGLDEEITRAEVAQLVNFYLLRAPADVSSSTKTQFSDVSKRHDLFADIVEATRAEHTYTITKEGYEVEVEIED